MLQPCIHPVVFHRVRGQVVVLGIQFQQALPFQKAADPMDDGARQLGEFQLGRCLNPMKSAHIGATEVTPSRNNMCKWMFKREYADWFRR